VTKSFMSEAAYPDEIPAYPDREAQAIKLPPHSIQGEQSVLGGLMLDNSAWEKIADQV
jgi:replicative DNA helicase